MTTTRGAPLVWHLIARVKWAVLPSLVWRWPLCHCSPGTSILADQERIALRNGDPRPDGPRRVAIVNHETGQEILVLTGGLAVFQ